MKTFSKIAALALLLLALVPATAAQAQDCSQDPYCNPDTPSNDSNDRNDDDDTDVEDSDFEECVEDGVGESDDTLGEECETPRGELCDEQNGGAANGGTDDEDVCDDTDVLPSESENTPTGGGTDTGAGDAEGPAGAAAEADAATAPSGALPLTGGDIIGMAAIGAVALGLGTVLVRRSRTMKSAA